MSTRTGESSHRAFTEAMPASFWAGAAGVLAAAVLAVVLIRDGKSPTAAAGDEPAEAEAPRADDLTTAA
ncbi:hypothetical protein [Streptomyces sp. NPDC003006]